MIDAMYNYRQGEIHSAEFSDEFNRLCIPFENSLSEERNENHLQGRFQGRCNYDAGDSGLI